MTTTTATCVECKGFGIVATADAENGPDFDGIEYCGCAAGLARYDADFAAAQGVAADARAFDAKVGAESALDTVCRIAAAYRVEKFNLDVMRATMSHADHIALADAARAYAVAYEGDFPYMRDMSAKARTPRGLSDGMTKGVLNCMLAECRRRNRPAAPVAAVDADDLAADAWQAHVASRAADPVMTDRGRAMWESLNRPAAAGSFADVPDGIYTVVEPGGDHITLRVRVWKTKADGTRVLSMLTGPANESDYTGVGTINPDGTYAVWRAYRGNDRIVEAAAALATMNDEDAAGARERYAMASGRCAICNRTLTVPASLNRGIGPECLKKL